MSCYVVAKVFLVVARVMLGYSGMLLVCCQAVSMVI